MTLTGAALPGTLALLLVTALVAVFVFWKRVGGPRWVRVAQRFLLLLATQVATVVLVAVLVNDSGGFFTSWDDLFGSDSGAVSRFVVHADHDARARVHRGGDRPGFATPQQRAARGELTTLTVDGAASGLHVSVDVYLPPQYFQPSYAGYEFPAIAVLGSALDRPRAGQLRAVSLGYLRQLQAGTSAPAVLVLLDSPLRSGAGSACLNTAQGPQTPEVLASDLPSAVSHAYRVRAVGWGVVGSGAGGYCAMKMALTAPYLYYSAASINGYLVPPRDPAIGGGTTAGDNGLVSLNNLIERLRVLPVPPVTVLVVRTPVADGGSRGQTATARGLSRAPMRITSVVSTNGAAVASAVSWLSRQLPAPAVQRR